MSGKVHKIGTVGIQLLGLAAAGLLAVSCSPPAVPSRPDVALVHLDRTPLEESLPSTETISPMAERGLEAEVVARINRYRERKGLPPFARHHGLDQLAEEHARDMRNIRHMSHDGFKRRANAARNVYAMSWLAENLMWGVRYKEDRLAEIIVEAWIDSRGHRENLLRDNQFIGVGIARGSDGSLWATQLSARPH